MRKIFITILITGLLTGAASYLAQAATSTIAFSFGITAGTLTIAAPASLNLGSVDYSYDGQTITADQALDNLQPSDMRGSGAGWTIIATCVDWTADGETLDYDGDGITTGQLTIDQDSVTVSKTAGQAIDGTYGPTVGATDSFSATTASITVLSADAGYGEGEYDADNYTVQQFIPASQHSGDYTTTLTLTIS